MDRLDLIIFQEKVTLKNFCLFFKMVDGAETWTSQKLWSVVIKGVNLDMEHLPIYRKF
jgi:hypothetical protein